MVEMMKRVIDTSFWTDDKVMDLFSPEDKLVFLYLLTNPHTTQLGIYSLNPKFIAFDIGCSLDEAKEFLNKFEDQYHLIERSKITNEILIKNYLRHSIVKGGKPVEDLLKREINNVKDRSLLKHLHDYLIQFDNLLDSVKNILPLIDVNDNENANDNENENDVSYHDSYHDSYDDSSKPDPKPKPKKSSIKELVEGYSNNFHMVEDLYAFIEMRKKMKAPMTEQAVKLALNKLSSLTQNEEEAIKIIEQSIEHGWKSFYPLKEEKPKTRQEELHQLYEKYKKEEEESGQKRHDDPDEFSFSDIFQLESGEL